MGNKLRPSNPMFASATSGAAVTPSDATTVSYMALWIGGAGTGQLTVDLLNGDTVTFTGVPVGVMPIAVSKVYSTGTGVTGIVGMNW